MIRTFGTILVIIGSVVLATMIGLLVISAHDPGVGRADRVAVASPDIWTSIPVSPNRAGTTEAHLPTPTSHDYQVARERDNQHVIPSPATAEPDQLVPDTLELTPEQLMQTSSPTPTSVDSVRRTTRPTPAKAVPTEELPPPTHLAIPSVGIDTEVIEVSAQMQEIAGQHVLVWQVADWAAGHHDTSANPGEGGNVVIAGHDDTRGEVFRGLHDISVKDRVTVSSAAGAFEYVVEEVHLRRYNDVSLDEQLAIGVFMGTMPEERLTLITCWPYGIDDHRLIVVAKPLTEAVVTDHVNDLLP